MDDNWIVAAYNLENPHRDAAGWPTIEDAVNYYIDRGFRVVKLDANAVTMGFWDVQRLLRQEPLLATAPDIVIDLVREHGAEPLL